MSAHACIFKPYQTQTNTHMEITTMALSRADKEQAIKIGINIVKKNNPGMTTIDAVDGMIKAAIGDKNINMIKDLKHFKKKYFKK